MDITDKIINRNPIVAYRLHDPISNTEGQITNFDKDILRQAVSSGKIVVAVRKNGAREIADVESVREIDNAYVNGIELVTPKYVDERINAIISAITEISSALVEVVPEQKNIKIKSVINTCSSFKK